MNTERIPRTLRDALAAGHVIPFAGAGVSRAVRRLPSDQGTSVAAFPNWVELLRGASDRLREEGKAADADLVYALLSVDPPQTLDAAKHAKERLGPAIWSDYLVSRFAVPRNTIDNESLSLARLLWELGSSLLVTTNYDDVLHWAAPSHSRPRIWRIGNPYALARLRSKGNDEPTVWHLHGHIEEPDRLILTPDDYTTLYGEPSLRPVYAAALETLRDLLVSRTFLFVGFSLSDRYLANQLRWLFDTYEGQAGPHYVLVTRDQAGQLQTDYSHLGIEPVLFLKHGPPLVQIVKSMAACTAAQGTPRRHSDDITPTQITSDGALRKLKVRAPTATKARGHEHYTELIARLRPSTTDQLTEEARSFYETLTKTFLYSHDVGGREEQFIPGSDPVLTMLHEKFWECMYVPRREEREIVSSLKHHRMLVVMGHAGAGKSTLLQKVARDQEWSLLQGIYYIDLRMSAPEFLDNSQQALAAVLYREVLHGYLDGVTNKNRDEAKTIISQFRLYRVRNHPGLSRLFEQIRFEHGDVADGELASLLESPSYADELRDMEMHLEGTSDQDLILLLRFLGIRDHHPIIILDNIDRYSLEFQRSTIDFLTLLQVQPPARVTPVLAIRTMNFMRMDVTKVDDHVILPLSIGPQHDKPWSQVLTEVFEHRLQMSVDTWEATRTSSSHLPKRKDRAFVEHSQAVTALLQNYEKILASGMTEAYLQWLAAWANYSIRQTAYTLLQYVRHYLPSSRDLSIHGDESSSVSGTRLMSSDLRTSLLRYLIMGEAESALPTWLNVFAQAESGRQGLLAFPRLRVLEFLMNRKDNTTTLSELVTSFGVFGVCREDIEEVVRLLAVARGSEARALVFVDAPDLDRGLCAESLLQILPSGEFLLSTIIPTVEYLFLMGLTRLDRDDVLLGQLSADKVPGSRLRVEIAIHYLSQHIIPALAQEVRAISNLQDDQSMQRLYRQWFRVHGKLTVDRIQGGLFAYVSGFTRDKELEESLVAIRSRIEQLDQ